MNKKKGCMGDPARVYYYKLETLVTFIVITFPFHFLDGKKYNSSI